MLKVMIVEDEKPAREKLKYQLSQLENVQLIAEASKVDEAQQLLETQIPDVILLDIQLGPLTGLDLLDSIELDCHVIFTTAYSQYAIDAFEKGALDYLLKPFNLTRLKQALERVTTQPAPLSIASPTTIKRITAKSGDKIHLLVPEDIIYIHSRHGIVFAVLPEREYALDVSLDKLQEQFPQLFIRLHRQHLVNLAHIKQLERWRNGNFLMRFNGIDETLTSSRQGSGLLKAIFGL